MRRAAALTLGMLAGGAMVVMLTRNRRTAPHPPREAEPARSAPEDAEPIDSASDDSFPASDPPAWTGTTVYGQGG